MTAQEPVMILGAPRSGSSLLQKMIRECDGFRSVAKEADFIWQPFTHPENNNWRFEGWVGSRLREDERAALIGGFDEYAVSASFWRGSSALGIPRLQRSRYLRPVIKVGYRVLASLSNRGKFSSRNEVSAARIVDKSVHSPLWLNLVHQTFPDARFIHITRRSESTIPSMISGWLNPNRFFTYDLPGGLQIPDYPFNQWNFALPAGWEEWRSRWLAEVVAFQWMALQRAAITFFESPDAPPLLRVNLEQLVSDPQETLRGIARFINVREPSRWESIAGNLPQINARPEAERRQMAREIQERMTKIGPDVASQIDAIDKELGYG